MADGRGDMEPVSYGRWFEAHTALADRVRAIEDAVRASNFAAVHQRLDERVTDLESDIAAIRAAEAKRKDRQWTLTLAFLTGLALPLAVAAVIALSAALH